jgi:hypothetical protein
MLDRTAGIFKSATSLVPENGSARTSFPACGSDETANENEWFARFVRIALDKDAGAHMHHITGFPKSSCYYWAKGERSPPLNFFRKLLHSEYGEPFLLALMENCEADWWREFVRHHRMGEAADRAS